MEIQNFMRRTATIGGVGNYTHEIFYVKNANGSAFSPGARYKVRDENMGELYAEYCRSKDEGIEDLSLGEKPREIMPLIISLNLVFDSQVYNDPYDDDFVIHFVHAIQQVMKQDLEINNNQHKTLICCFLESAPVESEDQKTTSVQLRFQFPYCRCDVDVQTKTIIPHLIRRVSSGALNSKLYETPMGSWKDWIDTDFYTRSVPMYGSKVGHKAPELTLNKILNALDENELNDHDDEIERSIRDTFHYDDHDFVHSGIINRSIFRVNSTPEYWLPVFLSINYGYIVVLPRRKSRNSPGSTFMPDTRYDISNFGKGGDLEEMSKLDVAAIFLKMWKPERILTKEYWLVLGEALYDADDGNDAGLQLWVEFTEKAIEMTNEKPPYFIKYSVEDTCNSHYCTFRLNRTTIKTLAWCAREDDYAAYNAWHEPWCRTAMELAALTCLDNDVARAFYRVYWLDAFCTYEGKRIIWYVFAKHKLKLNPAGHLLTHLMSNDFHKRFLKMLGDVVETLKNTNDNGEQDKGRRIIASINKLMGMLKTRSKKATFLAESSESFVHDELDILMDENPEIMGLPNGVLVATTEKYTIRKGRPEDYVTRSINVAWRKDFSWDHPKVREVLKWMHQTFPDEELCRQWRKILASLLRGGNNDKKFYTLSGQGNNSKSMWIKALENVLGPYCIKFPVSMITGSRSDANGPSPAMARSKGTRLCVLEEPEEDIPLRGAIIKYLTGSDSFFARFLKKNGGDIRPLFKLFLMCNKIPAIPTGGNAMRERMSVMPCIAKWCDDAPEDEEEQMKQGKFPIDPFFDSKIPIMASALFWIMTQDYDLYIKEGVRKEPDIVKKYTQQYWDDNDVYYQFIAECISPAVDESGQVDSNVKLSIDTIYTAFKNWFKDSFPGMRRIPDRPTVRTELSSRWSRPTDGCWAGIQMKTTVVNLNQNDRSLLAVA